MNLNLELDNSRARTRRKFKYILMFLFIALLAAAIYFTVPQLLHFQMSTAEIDGEEIDGEEKIIKSLPLPNLEAIRTAQYHAQLEQEMKNVLENKHIDPLTTYIEKNRLNEVKAPYVERVKIERDRRCQEVEDRYQRLKKDYTTFIKLKTQYNYSCPQVINNFLELMKKNGGN
jgi:hypothetical protein